MNWKSIGFLAAAVAFGVFTLYSGGCSLDDTIQVRVPDKVQKDTGADPKVSLSEAPYVREQYVADFTRGLSQFDENYEDAIWFKDLIGSVVDSSIPLIDSALQGVPGGAIILSLLTGLGGLYVSKPGAKDDMKKKVDEAWDEATKEAERLIREGRNAS
ncbi:MAG: hypothetical protein AAGI37_19750 [Planctomycetota bacterium]